MPRQYLQKNVGDKVDYLPADKHEIFYKLIASLSVGLARHGQSTQNNKFAISLQYLKENMMDEVDFFPADKY